MRIFLCGEDRIGLAYDLSAILMQYMDMTQLQVSRNTGRIPAGSEGILIFCGKTRMKRPPAQGIFAAVTESDNRSALKFLVQNPIPTVTCGMSSLNTVSLSGRQGDTASVSIQREIPLPGKDPVPMGELLLRVPEQVQDYTVMAAGAVLLLCGEYDRLCP